MTGPQMADRSLQNKSVNYSIKRSYFEDDFILS